MDWECGGRDKATCERLTQWLARWRIRLYCTDAYAAYTVLLPLGQHYTGKDETHGMSGTTPRSGIGWPASDAAPSWSRKSNAWWASASPCLPASPGTVGSATSYLCSPKTLDDFTALDLVSAA